MKRSRASRGESLLAGLVLLLLSRAFVNLFAGDKTGVPPVLPVGPVGELFLQGLAFAIATLLVARHAKRVARALTRDLVPSLVVLLGAASIAWSAAPMIGLRDVVAAGVATLFGAYLASRYDALGLVRLIAAVLVFATLASAAVVWLVPGAGIASGSHAGAWTGVFDHKNTLGMRLALGFAVVPVLAMSEPRRTGRAAWWIAGLAMGGVLLASDSKTSLAIAATLIVLAPLVARVRRRPVELAVLATTALLVAAGVVLTIPAVGPDVLDAVNPRGTLLGRTRLWLAVADEIARRPIVGFGIGGFWQDGAGPDAAIARMFPWGPNHAHNGLLELALALGATGAGLMLAHLVVVATRAVRFAVDGGSTGAAAWPLLFFVWYALSNVTYSNLAVQSTFYWTLYVAVALQLSRRSLLLRDLDRRAGSFETRSVQPEPAS